MWELLCFDRGGHADDVLDVSWAPDGSALLSGSIENVAVVWDVAKGKGQARLTEHAHYVQGVAWDPASRFLVSQSSDRTCRCTVTLFLPAAAAMTALDGLPTVLAQLGTACLPLQHALPGVLVVADSYGQQGG